MRRKLPIQIFFYGWLIILSSCSSTDQDLSNPTSTTIPEMTLLPTDPPADPTSTKESTLTPTPLSFNLTSLAFNAGGMIPVQYTRKGADLSPPLEWGEPPGGTKSFALILYSDPLKDGGGNWVQWILYNIPADTRALPEGIIPDEEGRLADGSQHFKNSWGELNYGGPNPQHTYTFQYYFVLYALDTSLDLNAVEIQMEEAGTLPWIGSSKAVLEQAVEGHVLGLGELEAKYKEELD